MNKKRRKSREEIIYHIIVVPVFLAFTFICVYPFYYLLICTISDNQAVELGKVLFAPVGFHLGNYIKILKLPNLVHSVGVSLARVFVGVFLHLFTCTYMAYFFTRQEMWARKFWYRLVVITMYFSAGLIPAYLNLRMLKLPNTFWVYVIPGMIGVYNMVLIKTSIEAVPAELEESAYLDGAGYFARLFRIILPLLKPILATTGLFSAVNHWNDFFTTKLYITNTKLYTVQFVLHEMLQRANAAAADMEGMDGVAAISSPKNLQYAITVVVMVPIMCVYPFIQKYYVKGVMIGAVKG